MTPRAITVYWDVAMNEPERVLDDLARWTDINTVIVGVNYNKEYAVRSAQPFGELPVPVVTGEEFDSLLRFVDLAKSKGFNISCHVGPINPLPLEALAPLSCIDVTGNRAFETDYVVQGCPNNPDVRHFGETLVREIVGSWPSLDMLDFDHMEYPRWPHLGLSELFVCFCEFCRKKAESQGIDFDQMKQEAAALYSTLVTPAPAGPTPLSNVSVMDLVNFLLKRPQLAVWLNFRMASMTEFITRVTEAAREAAREHNPDLQIGIDVHLPSICHLIGTDFTELYPLYDWVSPKFPDYVPGSVIPLIADEIASKTGRWGASELVAVLRELHDLGPGPKEYPAAEDPNQSTLYSSNVFDTPDIVRRQMKYINPILGKVPVHPLVFISGRDVGHMRKKVDALRQHGFDGYLILGPEKGPTTEFLKESTGIF